MVRCGRVRNKKNPKKRGPKSYVEKAKLPKGAGIKKRKQFRINTKLKTAGTMKGYRAGYTIMFDRAPRYCRSLKRLPEPGSLPPNQHDGFMPALPGRVHLSGKQASTILEKVAEHPESSYADVRAVSRTLSYLHSLVVGTNSSNWPEVTEMLELYGPEDYVLKRPSLKPTMIPSPSGMAKAFTKGWKRSCPWPYAKWNTGLVSAWCWAFCGNRPVDMKSLKTSTDHSGEFGVWAATEMDGGRNKLQGKKRGTRRWWCYFVCMCPGAKHVPIPEEYEWGWTPEGSPRSKPTFCTSCPLNALELKKRRAIDGEWRLFSKWTPTTQTWNSNYGDPITLAIEWFRVQGCLPDGLTFDHHAGRRALAALLDVTNTPYHEGCQLHGDGEDVWRDNYQPSLVNPGSYCERKQSRVAYVCTT